MRITSCSRGICAVISVLFISALILEAPVLLAVSSSLLLLLIIRYLMFMQDVRATLQTIQIVRSIEKRLFRQGRIINVQTSLEILIPALMQVEYREFFPDFFSAEGSLRTGYLSAGHRTCLLSYSVTPMIHGHFHFPGGSVTLSDPFYTLDIPLTRDDFTGPSLFVLPYPIFERNDGKYGSEVKRDRAGFVQGYDIRLFRPYISGDDLRRVDWKMSAKRGTLFVREYTGQDEGILMLIVDLPDQYRQIDSYRFSRFAGIISGYVEHLLVQKEPLSLLLISGPNFYDISYDGQDMGEFMLILREQIHPKVRVNSWYRKGRRADLRSKIHWQNTLDGTHDVNPGGVPPWTPGKRDEKEFFIQKGQEMFFFNRIRFLSELHIRESCISQFQARVSRIMSSRSINVLLLYTLGEGDLSHIHEIAEVAHRRNIKVHVRIPSPDPHEAEQIREALSGIPVEMI